MTTSATRHMHTAPVDNDIQDGGNLPGALDAYGSKDEYHPKEASEMRDTESTLDQNTKAAHELLDTSLNTQNPMRAVLDVTELLEMTLSHLSINDLARCLAVSKHWHSSILGSIALRRTLFLEPSPTREYIKSVAQHGSKQVYALLREPVKGSLAIVEPHPALLPLTESHEVWVKETRWISCDVLRNVRPETLLFQPPITKVIVWQRREDSTRKLIHEVVCAVGVTFDALLGAIRVKRERHEEACRQAVHGCCRGVDGGPEMFKVYAWGAVTGGQDEVKSAREALVKSEVSVEESE